MKFQIKVPASTANLGPGFDTLGLALDLYLQLVVTLPGNSKTPDSNYPDITITNEIYSSTIPLKAEDNLITQACISVAKLHGVSLPSMSIHCINQIPFGSGLGSSGSAIVAGVMLADKVCNLSLTKEQLLPFCLDFEGHPDNVAPSLFGGFIAAYMEDSRNAIHVQLPFHKKIKAVVVTPDYALPTIEARNCLPETYTMKDMVYNLQRVAVLSTAFADPDSKVIYGAMHDKLHQTYRKHLIPGLSSILAMTEEDFPGLLGVALSGAGPSVLALCIDNHQLIGDAMSVFLAVDGATSTVRILNCDIRGAQIIE